MDKLVIGKIINTRGLKGEVKVANYSSFIKDRYKVGNEVFLSKDEENFIIIGNCCRNVFLWFNSKRSVNQVNCR